MSVSIADTVFLHHQLEKLIYDCNYNDSDAISDLLGAVETCFLSPSPKLWVSARNAASRQNLIQGKVGKSLLQLTEAQIRAVLNLADALDVDELYCLDCWIAASDEKTRRQLADITAKPQQYFDNNIATAAMYLMKLQGLHVLRSLQAVLKAGRDEKAQAFTPSSSETKSSLLASFSNGLLSQGLIQKLIQSIRLGFSRNASSVAAMTRDEEYDREVLEQLAGALFLALHEIQITPEENRELSELIKHASALLTSSPARALVAPLIILQLTQVTALEQTVAFFRREGEPGRHTSVGNTLPQRAETREGLDALDWTGSCKGVKGVSCLAHAILRQPLVDADQAPVEDVIWFLQEACQLRAYSYLRVCVLPVLQSRDLSDRALSSMLTTVLERLVEHIVTILCLPVYRMQFESGFPFFPVEPPVESFCDSFEDFLWLLHDLAFLRPAFASFFWKISEASEYSEDPRVVPHHPFLHVISRASSHNDKLLLATWRFFAALARGREGRNALVAHSFIRLNVHHPEMNWSFFFAAIGSVVSSLTPKPVSTLSTGAGRGGYLEGFHLGGSSAPTMAASSRITPLTAEDIESLGAILELLASVTSAREAAIKLLREGYQPVAKVLAMVTCPLPIDIRGLALQVLASFVRADEGAAKEVWEALVAPSAAVESLAPPALGRGLGSPLLRIVREDLEDSETRAMKYPVTDAFLSLLQALLESSALAVSASPATYLSAAAQETSGLPLFFLDYVVDDIFLKLMKRAYAPPGQAWLGQRFRLASRCLYLMTTILRQYDLSPGSRVADADFSDTFLALSIADGSLDFSRGGSQKRVPRPKSAGFVIMSLLLSRTKLFQTCLELLDQASLAAVLESQDTRWSEICEDVLGIVKNTKIGSTSSAQLLRSSLIQEAHETEPDLSVYGVSPTACDCAYWRLLTATNIIGLFRECLLLEGRYLQLFRSAAAESPLSLVRLEDGRPVTKLLLAQSFAEILTEHVSCLGHIAEYIVPPPVDLAVSRPSVSVLAVQLVERVALSVPYQRLAGILLASPVSAEALLQRAVDGIIHDYPEEWSTSDKDELLGGRERLLVFTGSTTAPLQTVELIASLEGNREAVGSTREAILSLLLSSLARGYDGLARALLPSLDPQQPSSQPDCLEAILTFLLNDVLEVFPREVARCCEVLHRLVSISEVSRQVLRSLRREQRLDELVRRFVLTVDHLPALADPAVKVAACVSCGYLLRVVAVEVLGEVTGGLVHGLNSTIQLLLSPEEESSSLVHLATILRGILEGSVAAGAVSVDGIPQTLLPLVRQSLRDIKIGHDSCKQVYPGLSLVDLRHLDVLATQASPVNEASQASKPWAERSWLLAPSAAPVIGAEDLVEVRRVGTDWNTSAQTLAAAFFLGQSWRQVIALILRQLASSRVNDSSTFEHIVVQLILPAVDVLGSEDLSPIVSSVVAEAALDMVDFYTSEVVKVCDKTVRSDFFEAILVSMSKALRASLVRGHPPEYRAYTHIALTKLLQVPVHPSLASSSSSSGQREALMGSEEDKSSVVDDSRQLGQSLRRLAQLALGASLGDLVEVLGKDIIEGSTEGRLTSMTALSSLLLLFQPHHGKLEAKAVGLVRLMTSSTRGYLRALVGTLDASIMREEDGSLELALSSLAVCTQIAECSEGVDALVALDIFPRLLHWTSLREDPPPPALRELLLASLTLLTTLVASLPHDEPVAVVHAGCADFLKQDIHALAGLLRRVVNSMNLVDLKCAERLACLMALLASPPTSQTQSPWDVHLSSSVLSSEAVKVLRSFATLATAVSLEQGQGQEQELVVKTLCHLSVFFRRRSVSAPASEALALVESFTVLAPAARGSDSLKYAAENILGGLADLVSSMDGEVIASQSAALDRAVRLGETFPQTSFIRRIARWMRGRLFDTTSSSDFITSSLT